MPSYKDEKTGKWYCSFYYTDIKGKRVRKLKRGFKFKREADKFERDWLSTKHGEEITISALISSYEQHLNNQYALGNIRHSTLVAYQNRIRLYIKPYWNDVIASLVKPKDVDDWLAKITKLEQKPLSPDNTYYDRTKTERKTKRSSRTVNDARAMLMRIFDFAKKNFQITSNPVEDSTRLKRFIQDKRAKYWTMEQYQQFSQALNRQDMKVMFDIIFYAGLRIGELLALTPNDIGEYYIDVNKALVQESYDEEYFGDPKNESSIRVVEIPKFLHKTVCEYIKSVKGIRDTDVIFVVPEQTIRNYMDNNSRRLGLPKISPHILRHSYASHLLSLCKDPMVVAKQLGHATPETTLKVYAHMIQGNDRSAVDILEEFVKNKK